MLSSDKSETNIQHEVAKLRTEVRNLRRLLAGGAFLLIGWIFVGASSTAPHLDEVITRRLVIVDQNDKEVAMMGVDRDGVALFLKRPQDGRPMVELFATASDAGALVKQKDGKPAVRLQSTDEGGRVIVYDRQGGDSFSVFPTTRPTRGEIKQVKNTRTNSAAE